MAYRNREEEKLERREEQTRTEVAGAATGEKPKKTWKEVDMQRDGSRSSSDRNSSSRGGASRSKPETASYRAYKSKLGRLFEGGGDVKMPEATVIEVVRGGEKAPLLPKAVEEAPVPLTPKEQLKAAETPEAIDAAARCCLTAGGLPLDNELLLKVLTLKDETILLPALEAVLDAMEKGRPKNAKALIAQIALCQLANPHAIDIAKGIRARLGG